MLKKGYFRADIERSIFDIRFFLAIIVEICLMYIASYEIMQWRNNVMIVMYFVTNSTPFLVAYMIAAFPYSGSFAEDIEYKYYYVQLVRGDIRKYVFSKVMSIFLSTCFVMAISIWFFSLLLHIRYPWFITGDDIYRTLIEDGSFKTLLKREYFMLYYFCIGMQKGLFAGLLALLATIASLFYSNQLFSLTIPGLSWYVLDVLAIKFDLPEYIRLPYIFSQNNNLGGNNIISIGVMFIVAGIGIAILKIIIQKIFERRWIYAK